MKKLLTLCCLVLLASSSLPAFAQSSVQVGLNTAKTTQNGFWGLNPTFEFQSSLFSRLNLEVRINGFFDIMPSTSPIERYHRSIYSDLGLNFKIIDRVVNWDISAGGTYQNGEEVYFTGSIPEEDRGFYGVPVTDISRLGAYVRNSVGFGGKLGLNVTVYRFGYWGEYVSFGPTFELK